MAAGLSYLSMIILGPIIPIVFFFVEKSNRFVKFHAAQGILYSIAGIVVGIVYFIINTAVIAAASGSSTTSATATGAGLVILAFACLFILVGLAFLGFWIYAMIGAFSGKYTKLPLIGGIAESWAGGPATPLY